MLARHFCNHQKYIMLALVLLAVLTLTGTVASPVWALTTTPAQDTATPLQVQLKIDKLPTFGQTATLSCVATTARPAPNTTVQIQLPEGAQLVDGSARWSGNLQPGSPVTLTATVRFTKLGNTEIACRARKVWDAQNSWGDYRALYFTLGQQLSHPGYEIQKFNQGSYAGGADASAIDVPERGPISIPSNREMPAPPAVAPATDGAADEPAPAAPTGNLIITGTWKYYNRANLLAPAKQFLIELVNGTTYAHLAWCYTNIYGAYTCGPVVNPGGAGVRTLFFSYVSYLPYSDVLQVTDGTGATFSDVYWFQTGNKIFADGTRSMGSYYIPKDNLYKRAYWVKDDLDRAWKFIFNKTGKNQVPQETAGPSTVFWYPGSTDGTYYSFGGQIHLDESDPLSHDTAIHEYGHNVMYNKYGGFPTTYCPSPHYVNGYSHPNCAWTEGWANFLPLAVNNSPVYHWDDGYGLNLETPTWGTANWDSGDGVEGRVAGALWDMYDALVDGTDTYAGGFVNIWDTFFHQTDSNFREYYLAWIYRSHGTAPQLAIYRNTIDYRTPAAMTLSSPAAGAVLHTNYPTLYWNTSLRATYYELRIRQGTTTGPIIVDYFTGGSPYYSSYLAYGWYYWQVRGCNDFGCGPYTALRSLHLLP